MRLTKARIEPLPVDRLREVSLELFGKAPTVALNLAGLWAVHPQLMSAQRGLQQHIFHTLTISPRLREIAILRTGWLCRSGYELAQHAELGKRAGLDADDLARIVEGAASPGWTRLEAATIRAVDEMVADAFISSETWQVLGEELDSRQLLDLMSVVGRYWCVSVILNSTGLQLEHDALRFEDHLRAHP